MAEAHTQPLRFSCLQCGAAVGRPCVQPGDELSRRPGWFHSGRWERALAELATPGVTVKSRLLELALKLSEEADLTSGAAQSHADAGDREKGYRAVGKAEGLLAAARQLQAFAHGLQ